MTALPTALRQRRAWLSIGIVGLAALFAAVVVSPPMSTIQPTPSPTGGPSRADATQVQRPTTSAEPAIEEPSTPWEALDLPPLNAIATFVPTRTDRDLVKTDTAFTLRSLGQRNAVDLATALTVQPPVEFTVKPGTSARLATVRPRAALDPGQLYRFTLHLPDGTSGGSWAFQAAAPLHVVTMLPNDQATKVPVDTGIELTFDQDGVIDLAARFSIDPAVKGTFEQHGRTVVFVPDALQRATVYTVRLAHGVAVDGSDSSLEHDVQIRFETEPAESAGTVAPDRPSVWFGFDRPMIEVRPGDAPTLAVQISGSSNAIMRAPFPAAVYRLPSEAAGIDAVDQLTTAPYWAIWSAAGLVSTAGLPRVALFMAHPKAIESFGESTFQVPVPLDAGWYLVEIPRPERAAQAVLQVTDIAAYSAVTSDRLVVWANDIATGAALSGARVSVVGGGALGLTSRDGLLVANGSSAIRAAATATSDSTPQQLAIRTEDGRSLVVPVGLARGGGAYLWDVSREGEATDSSTDYWRFMATDRGVYRSTDTIHFWGYLRPRDSAQPPRDASVSLTSEGGSPEIKSTPVTVDRTGAFAASLAVLDLPNGYYLLRLKAGETSLASIYLQVAEIRKPAYSLSISTDRHVVVAGDPVTLTGRATFFDGTPVPGVELAVRMFDTPVRATTDGSGSITVNGVATANASGISVQPARAEEAEITASTYLHVYPSRVTIDADATIRRGVIALTGTLRTVDVERLEAAWPDEWSIEGSGSAVANAPVSVEVVEQVLVVTKTHRFYDFIAKKVVVTHDYGWHEVRRHTQALRSAADGAFQLEIPATRTHDYEFHLSALDAAGRQANGWADAHSPYRPQQSVRGGSFVPYLAAQGCRPPDAGAYRIGDPMCLQLQNDAGPLPSGGTNHYLFLVAQRGLHQAIVQDTPVYQSTFTAADVPNVEVWGVRFSGTSYSPVEQPYWAQFDAEQRRLTVALTADRGRYAPGQTVTLDLRTVDASGKPVSAAVVLRAVDEKLYAIGAATEQDPLRDLYADSVPSELLWTHSSHPVPFVRGEHLDGGDTSGGGGEREDFADVLLFRKVTTNAAGHARVSFKLSDDLTSWHVSASATTAVPDGGTGSIVIPVGLPFFVDATLAPEYLAGEHPSVRIRAYGSALQAGDQVTYTVSSGSLGMRAVTVGGSAFDEINVPLPALSIGTRDVTISGTVRHGGTTLSDRLTRRFEVVASRLTSTRASYVALSKGSRPEGGTGWTTYVFSDAGRGRYLSVLQSLAWSGGPRVDQGLAAVIARKTLIRDFGVKPDQLPAATFEPGQYQKGDGISLLPYASANLGLTARVAIIAGDQFDQQQLADALQQVVDDPTATRERRMIALAGLAGLGRPVLVAVRRAAADRDLTERERLYLALGAAALGDDATALTIERDLLGTYGERRGASMRLRVGTSLDDTIEATSLAALIAAQLGESFAPELEAYVDVNPAVDELYGLQQVSFVRRILGRTPAAAARFAYVLAGKRTVVDLGPGDSFSLRLLGEQRSGLSFEPISGRVGLGTSWQVPQDVRSIEPDLQVTLSRDVLPGYDIPSAAFVEVRLTARFGPQVVSGCYAVTDLVPSGLAPVARLQTPYGDSPDEAGRYLAPIDIQAQRVSFCAEPPARGRTVTMRYFARIVSPGEFAWEPAVIQSTSAAESINFTAAQRVTIH